MWLDRYLEDKVEQIAKNKSGGKKRTRREDTCKGREELGRRTSHYFSKVSLSKILSKLERFTSANQRNQQTIVYTCMQI